VLYLYVWLRQQIPDVGSEIQALVTYEDLQRERQGPDECPEALNNGFLLFLGFEREVDG
jgi:hypothetical protein